MNSKLGIYIHIPFCLSKCAYCDFYSLGYNTQVAEDYTNRLLSEIVRWGAKLKRPADTLYFGGGTPSLLPPHLIERIINVCKEKFGLEGAEITVENNPADNLKDWLGSVAQAGVNRISVGLQSSVDSELALLGRRHKAADVIKAVEDIKWSGINNFSLDLMLGIPNQTEKSLDKSIDFALSLEPNHISTYLLSLEKGTPLYNNRNSLQIPSQDLSADFYLQTCRRLEEKGYERYEISNFAKDGKISKHNTKYWILTDYLGLGPGAHSLIDGKRFYYDKNLKEYIKEPKEVFEGCVGGIEETLMLALRLSRGVDFNALIKENPNINFEEVIKKAQLFEKIGLLQKNGESFSLTDRGAVVSNSVITELLLALEC